MESFDWDGAAELGCYVERPSRRVLDDVERARRRLREGIAGVGPSELDRVGIGSDGSPRSMEQLLARVVHELMHHELHLRRGLGHPS